MKVARDEHERVLGIPLDVRLPIVGVQPRAVFVPVHVEDVRVAIAVRSHMWSAIRATTLRTARLAYRMNRRLEGHYLSGLYRIRHRNALALHAKHLHF